MSTRCLSVRVSCLALWPPDACLHADRLFLFLVQHYDDQMHVYTLIIWPTNTYEVKYDHAVVASGDLAADFNFPQNDPDIYKFDEAGSIGFLMVQVCKELRT